VREQMAELDAVLPALRASNETPFATTVRGTTYRERAEAAPVVVGQPASGVRRGKSVRQHQRIPHRDAAGRGGECEPSPHSARNAPPSVHRPVSQDLPDLVDTFRRRSGGPQTAVPSVYLRSPRRPLHGDEAPACPIMHRCNNAHTAADNGYYRRTTGGPGNGRNDCGELTIRGGRAAWFACSALPPCCPEGRGMQRKLAAPPTGHGRCCPVTVLVAVCELAALMRTGARLSA